MSRRVRSTLPALFAAIIVSACSSAPSPSPVPAGSGSPPAPTATTSATPPTSTPALTASPVTATTQLLVRGDARALGERVRLAPGPDGTVLVSVPHDAGAVLALLGDSGMARPGWPIAIENATSCGNPMPVPDGSVRIVCDGTDLPTFDNDPSDVRAFAFAGDGRLMDGWPVTLRPGPAARVLGADLALVESQVGTDVVATGVVSYAVWLTTIAADGTVHRGSKVPMVETCCGASLSIGPDGVGYAVESVGEWFEAGHETSRIMAFDGDGIRDGWPIEFDGNGSSAGFDSDGRPLVAVGPFAGDMSRVVAFGPRGSGSSGNLALSVVRGIGLGDLDCGHGGPVAPLASDDGTVFVFSEIDSRVLALDPTLAVKAGLAVRA